MANSLSDCRNGTRTPVRELVPRRAGVIVAGMLGQAQRADLRAVFLAEDDKIGQSDESIQKGGKAPGLSRVANRDQLDQMTKSNKSATAATNRHLPCLRLQPGP